MKTIKTVGNSRVSIKIMQDKTLRYVYKCGDCEFECSLFSEVGEPFKGLFKKMFKMIGLDSPPTKTKEYDVRPWLADSLE